MHQIGLLTMLSAFSAALAVSNPTTTVAHLPNVLSNAAKVDASGNIYLAGQNVSATSSSAYIAKLGPDGATIYAVSIGGTGASAAVVLDVDSAGSVYVAGTTTASDFPVSAGAPLPGATAFAAKLDAKGNILYSALIGRNGMTMPTSVAVNSKKELVVSGWVTTASSSGGALSLFILKLSADGTQITAGPPSVGGLVAVDAQDNIYVAGSQPSETAEPAATPGAFQGAPATYYCGCPLFGFACGGDQFVASLNPDLSRIRFLTYVTAKFGAAPSYIALDPQSDILIAGTTGAPGYPTTPGSYQPTYRAVSKTVETCGPPIPMEETSPSGYVTLVKGDGSGLIFSTFFSGSNNDSVSFAALTNTGIYLGGQAESVDLPGFDGAVPSSCLPVGFVTRMTLDGSAISSSHTPPGNPLAYDSTTGTLLLASANDLLRFDPSQDTPIACVLDAADLLPVNTVAPGELLSIFGRFLYFETDPLDPAINPVDGLFPVTYQGLGIMANQAPAPLLYVSPQQVNFQAPYEIEGNSQANIQMTYADVNGHNISDARTLTVVPSNPVAFLSQPPYIQSFPLALNGDGTINSSTNPAAADTIVTIFAAGLGTTSPLPITGMVNTSPAVPLNVPLVVAPYCNSGFCYPAPTFVSAESLPGSISGVTQIQLRVPTEATLMRSTQVIFSLSAGPVAVRDMNLSFWAR
jgi:uncharacterized protein (TIGR03437 family)